ncbi:imidazole glycerol phosphate synthase subunit HisF [Desulfogranum mediterraneum]|uniref:imidazole glycerol phosphate synthase subunit HisF n=1 Tax=Desulfogranum mediterraneum TaxID=160661 RepID=UPI00048F877F|nr:imidazole glycerol phosphate synthase cyclase subunit [Desulfogranum mediterraneum]
MKKNRMIPVLLLRNGWLVQSKGFQRYQNLGNPVWSVKRLSEWASDELIYIDISSDDKHDLRRDDIGHPNRQSFLEIIEDVSKETFMPITVGGRIRTLKDIEMRLSLGADKITINTQALEDPPFIGQAAKEFGSQCMVVSVDVLQDSGNYQVLSHGGTRVMNEDPVAWALEAQERGAGELFINSVDRDGMQNGYDIELLQKISSAVSIPVIACGGVGKWEHFAEAFDQTQVDAVAAANIFHYMDQSVFHAKKFLFKKEYNVRPPDLISI